MTGDSAMNISENGFLVNANIAPPMMIGAMTISSGTGTLSGLRGSLGQAEAGPP